MAKGIVEYSIAAYLKNIKFMLLFSIPALLGLLILLFIRMPTYPAIGSIYLRTGSIPDISPLQWAVIIVSYLASLFLISFAIVSINLVIKSERTMTNIGREVMRGLEKYVLNVFWIYLTATLLLLVAQLVTYELKLQQVLFPILSFLISLFIFYAPAGLVIDDLRPGRAIEKSIGIVVSKFPYFLLWLLIAFVILSVLDFVALAIIPHEFATILVVLFNSVILLPFLIVLQTQIYISKYTILT